MTAELLGFAWEYDYVGGRRGERRVFYANVLPAKNRRVVSVALSKEKALKLLLELSRGVIEGELRGEWPSPEVTP